MFRSSTADLPTNVGDGVPIGFAKAMPWLAAFCLILLTGIASAADTNYTKKPRFKIPYQSDPEEMKRIGAVEIQLHVSQDQGQKWEMIDSVSPAVGKFQYDAAQDGEYWFAVRTIDGRNKRHPDGPLKEELRVVVDRVAPELTLTLSELDGGRVQLSWTAQDANLDIGTLTLDYQDPGTNGWQPVGIVPAATGNTSWTVTQAGRVEVRASVSDLAGNTTNKEESTAVARVSKPANGQPDFSKPVAKLPEINKSVAKGPMTT